jgi:cytochrome c
MKTLIAILAVIMAGSASAAADRATPTEAKAMLDRAIAHYKSAGREKALADFSASRPPFGDRDLYVFCIAPDHTLVANGGFSQFVGQSADALKDSRGNSVAEAGWNAVARTGEGELRYQFFNPVTMLIEPKVTYFAKAGTDVCGVGAYDPL